MTFKNLITKKPKEEETKISKDTNVGFFVKWLILFIFLFYTLTPMIWLVISSFKTNAELVGNPFSLPGVWQVQNYVNAFKVSGLGRLFLNSTIVSLTATLLNVLFASNELQMEIE